MEVATDNSLPATYFQDCGMGDDAVDNLVVGTVAIVLIGVGMGIILIAVIHSRIFPGLGE